MQARKLTKLGILGGGQLAQMLAQNNPYSDLEIHILTEKKDCPAAIPESHITVGSPHHFEDVKNFVEKVDFITFENEFLNMDYFYELQKTLTKKLFFPQIPVLETVQNKLNQKFVFQKLKLPTAQFDVFQPEFQTLTTWLELLLQKYPTGCMLKWAQGGYDGKGNFVFKNITALKEALFFCTKATEKSIALYAEELIPFEKEVAMIYVRTLKGEFQNYPLVISEQHNNICKLVYGPATEFNIAPELEKQAQNYGKAIAQEFSYVGTFALEFFVTKNNLLLINEMAPRVHNTGHYTLDACHVNQFAAHIKAGFGSDIGPLTTFPFFAMLNILGKKELPSLIPPQTDLNDPFKVYWYNKNGSSLDRKLGHINTVGTSRSDIENKIQKMKQFEEKFWSEC